MPKPPVPKGKALNTRLSTESPRARRKGISLHLSVVATVNVFQPTSQPTILVGINNSATVEWEENVVEVSCQQSRFAT
jgi:hypothetical protein